MHTSKKLMVGLLAVLQVFTPIMASAQSGSATTLQYDAAGQVTQITSDGGRTKQLQWDGVGRLSSETSAGSIIGYAYNGQDAVTQVTDPRNLLTNYDRNGFGESRGLSSPDSANSSYVYDLNGNLTSRVNAAGQTESYVYDAANRITSKSISHPSLGTRTFAFTYGANATPEAGQVTVISTSGLVLRFSHNLLGQTTTAGQTFTGTSSTNLSTRYGYSDNGSLTDITYPSGRVVSYTLDSSSRIVGLSSSDTSLLSAITYSPLGALAGWTFGNNQIVTRAYDTNGRITSVSMPSGDRQYIYDADDRITGINDLFLGNATYEYDDLDRVTNANTAKGTWSYQYDANGNRINMMGSASNATVSIDTRSNRLLSTSGEPSRLYTYTTDGQPRTINKKPAVSACSNYGLSYQADGQLSASSATQPAVYSPDGLRLQKLTAPCAGNVTTNFVYDLAGHILGEYDAKGAVIQETVWLGDIPVAVFKPSVAATPFYVFADNLGSPRAITNANAQLVWQWDGEPFGASAANSNPSGLGNFVYNLRFPGQYLDVETGYHHNGWREYDPALGRYLQTDPIGLAGGINTYAYANGNPLSFADPAGLTVGIDAVLVVADAASFSFNAVTGNYIAATFDGAALIADAIPGVPAGAGVTVRAIRASGKVGEGLKYAVAGYDTLRACVKGLHLGLDSHHAGMASLYEKLIPGYNRATGASIVVPSAGHSSKLANVGKLDNSMINRKTGKEFDNVRDVLARDIKELRRVYPDIPNAQLRALSAKNKNDFPASFIKP